MARYTIKITETNYGSVEIEAPDENTAFEMAEEAFHNGEANWGNADLSIGEPVLVNQSIS